MPQMSRFSLTRQLEKLGVRRRVQDEHAFRAKVVHILSDKMKSMSVWRRLHQLPRVNPRACSKGLWPGRAAFAMRGLVRPADRVQWVVGITSQMN